MSRLQIFSNFNTSCRVRSCTFGPKNILSLVNRSWIVTRQHCFFDFLAVSSLTKGLDHSRHHAHLKQKKKEERRIFWPFGDFWFGTFTMLISLYNILFIFTCVHVHIVACISVLFLWFGTFLVLSYIPCPHYPSTNSMISPVVELLWQLRNRVQISLGGITSSVPDPPV